MPRTRFHEMEGSWVDIAASDQEDAASLTTSSSRPRPKRAAPALNNSAIKAPRRISARQSTSSSQHASNFIMPKLEAESQISTSTSTATLLSVAKARKRKVDVEYLDLDRDLKAKVAKTKKKDSVYDGASWILSAGLGWVFDVLSGSLQVVKTPLTYVIGIYLLFGLMVVASNAVTSRLSAALTPVCRIPGSGLIFSSLCQSSVKFEVEPNAEPEFDNLMQIQQSFEQLLQQSVDYYAVPAFMKQSQSAMRDVREVVRYGPLKSKNELILEFDTFISAASQASWDLESFNSHIGRTVDRIMLTARWTKMTLDEIAGPNITKGIVGNAVEKLMTPFQPVKFTEDAVLDLYIKHSDEVQHEILDLLLEAQAVFSLLKAMEDTLDSIHGIIARDTYYAKLGRDEVLAELWSRLGGNRKQKAMFEWQLKVLKQISIYGQAAYTNIGGAILKLQTMSAEIDQLKERLVSVDSGSEKGRVPLSVHLENIQLGVERLQEARGYARDARMEKRRAVIERGGEMLGHDANGLPESRKELPGKRT